MWGYTTHPFFFKVMVPIITKIDKMAIGINKSVLHLELNHCKLGAWSLIVWKQLTDSNNY